MPSIYEPRDYQNTVDRSPVIRPLNCSAGIPILDLYVGLLILYRSWAVDNFYVMHREN
mgnify:CR=1 FL=1